MSRFKSLDAMLASGYDRVVALRFTSVEGASLYAHACVLSNWSRVLANVLEDAYTTQLEAVDDAAAAAAAAGPVRHQTIPLDDADCTAWVDALSLMYPAVPLFQVTWSNAARLLLLADKYDMPAVAEHVKIFLDTPREAFGSTAAAAAAPGPLRLEAQLTSSSTPGLPNVFEWLQVTSKCRLEQQAQTCIQHIVQQQLPIPPGLVSAIQPLHVEALFNAMQQELQRVPALLQRAALPCEEYRCACCGNRWYQLPGSSQQPSISGSRQLLQFAAACVHCGENVEQLHPASVVAGAAAAVEDLEQAPSESLGTTDGGGDEDGADDAEEDAEDGSDEEMSQDSNSQAVDDDADEHDGSEDDAMRSSSDASDSEEEEEEEESD